LKFKKNWKNCILVQKGHKFSPPLSSDSLRVVNKLVMIYFPGIVSNNVNFIPVVVIKCQTVVCVW